MSKHENSKSPGILLYPAFEELKAAVEKLRTELSMLVLERDELLYVECKNIEMAYMLCIGGLAYKAYELECAILRLKRKAQLIRAKKNRQEKVILLDIEELLDFEFAEYQEKLKEQVNSMNAALERSRGQMLTEEETREIKSLYRSIVKSLHPDLHPDMGEASLQLFRNAVEAYERGDIDELRIINDMVKEPPLPDAKSDGLAVLAKEKDRLTKLLEGINTSIAKIKSEFPYTMKSIIQHPDKINAKIAELEEYTEQLNEIFRAYTATISEMLR